MPTRRVRLVAGASLVYGLMLGLAGCTKTTGVDVVNRTDRVLRVEYVDVTPTGVTNVYSTATLARDGALRHAATEDERGNGKRVRFTFADEPPEGSSAVWLSVPEAKSRSFDLKLRDGKLYAEELKKGREYGKSEGP